MRCGTVLRVVGCIIFVAGLVGGALVIIGVQAIIAAYPTDVISTANAATWGWGIAAYIWISSGFLACVIFTIGTMSNNLAEMNIKMEDVQNNTFETAKALRYIANAVSKQFAKETLSNAPNGTEPSAQYASRNYMRPKSNSTEA